MSRVNVSTKTLVVQPMIAIAVLSASAAAYADFNHQSWDSLLNKHVTMTNGGLRAYMWLSFYFSS